MNIGDMHGTAFKSVTTVPPPAHVLQYNKKKDTFPTACVPTVHAIAAPRVEVASNRKQILHKIAIDLTTSVRAKR